MSWATIKFESLDLDDPWRKWRLVTLAENFFAQPTASIPQAYDDCTDTQAAYRFFSNDKVEWKAILDAHIQSSVACMARQDVVLCIQDTSELDFNGEKVTGLGVLSYENQRAMYTHLTTLLVHRVRH